LGTYLLIVISVNEAKVAARDPNWFLVVCGVATDDTAVVLGWATNACWRLACHLIKRIAAAGCQPPCRSRSPS
jgi:hypothetical protein